MTHELTLGELARRFEDRFADVREDIQTLGLRLDSRVSLERYQLEREALGKEVAALSERVKAIETDRDREKRQKDADQRAAEEQRRADRRLIFTALIAPVLVLLLAVYLGTKGAST